MTYVIDVSNRQPTLTPADVVALRAASVEKVYVGLQYPGPAYPPGNAHLNIPMLRSAGLRVGCYFESTDPAVAWPNVAHLAAQLEDVYVAVEEGSAFEDEASIDAALAFADSLHLGGGGVAGIYSSPYEYHLLGLDGITKWSSRPLWDAAYNGEITLVLRTPYGGWTVADVAQYSEHGTVPGLGFEVDLDWEDSMAISPEFSERDAALLYQWVRLKGTPAQPGGVDVTPLEEQLNPRRRIYRAELPIVG